jgi:hypothetical protein
VKQYLAELKAAGEKSGLLDVDILGLEAWGQVHALADALKSQNLTATPADIQKALTTADMPTLTKKYGISPVDFSKPALPGPMAKLRLFSPYNTMWEFDAGGAPQPLVDGRQVSVTEKDLKIDRLG